RLEGAGSRAADRLAGRTVWCATAIPAGREAALALRDCLLWASDSGVSSTTLEPDELMGDNVLADDVVVVQDPLTAALAGAIRERGAHVVCRIEARTARGREVLSAVDAYLTSWLAPERGLRVERIAAVMPSAGAVTTMDVAPGPAAERRHDLGWSSALAAAIAGDRAETVGGTRHARPGVAAR
ncbi:MAG: hypothetical protein QOJ57_466, partial [Thermoleophilaceae bacterium]|nr:hypothetical protein [Thermoleophilaceae bacterium]